MNKLKHPVKALGWIIRQPWFALIVILAVGALSIGFTKREVQQEAARHSNVNRIELSHAIRGTLIENCVRGNDLRVVIRGIIAQEVPGIEQAIKDGRISRSDGAKAIAQVNKDVALVAITNCAKTYSQIH